MEMCARGSFIKMFTPQLLLPSAQKLMASNNAIPPNFGGSSPHVLSRCVYDICVCLIGKPVSVWRLLGGRGWGKSVRFVDSVPLSSPKTISPNMLTNVLLPGNFLRNSKTHQAFFQFKTRGRCVVSVSRVFLLIHLCFGYYSCSWKVLFWVFLFMKKLFPFFVRVSNFGKRQTFWSQHNGTKTITRLSKWCCWVNG